MTVGELKALLADIDDTLTVIVSKDAEGNDFKPLAEITRCDYAADSTYGGDVRIAPDDGEECDPDDWDPATNTVNAICLWPVN